MEMGKETMVFFLSVLLHVRLTFGTSPSNVGKLKPCSCLWSFNTNEPESCIIQQQDQVKLHWTYQPSVYKATLKLTEIDLNAHFSNGSEKKFAFDIRYENVGNIQNSSWTTDSTGDKPIEHLNFIHEKKTSTSGVLTISRPHSSEIEQLNIEVVLVDTNDMWIRSNGLDVQYLKSKDSSNCESVLGETPFHSFIQPIYVKTGANAIIDLTKYNMPQLYLNGKSYLLSFNGRYEWEKNESKLMNMNNKYKAVMSAIHPVVKGNETFISEYSVQAIAASGSSMSNSHTVTIETVNRKNQTVRGHFRIWAVPKPEFQTGSVVISVCEMKIPLRIKNFEAFFFMKILARVPKLIDQIVLKEENNTIIAGLGEIVSNRASKMEVHLRFVCRTGREKPVMESSHKYDLNYIWKDWNQQVKHDVGTETSEVDLHLGDSGWGILVFDSCYNIQELRRTSPNLRKPLRGKTVQLWVMRTNLNKFTQLQVVIDETSVLRKADLRAINPQPQKVTFLIFHKDGDVVAFYSGTVTMKGKSTQQAPPEQPNLWKWMTIAIILLFLLAGDSVCAYKLKNLKNRQRSTDSSRSTGRREAPLIRTDTQQ